MTRVAFALQAGLSDPAAWSTLAHRAEEAGFDAFVTADHPGVTPSPFIALAAAAAATSRIGVGTYVVNTGVRDPLHIAADAATLDVISGGRFQLGIGAGHTPAEWTMSGREYPSPNARVTRLQESAEVIRSLLDGHTVTYTGEQITTVEASLDAPRSEQRRIPMLIGGNNRRLLRFAAANADVVGIAGLGRTLADGHRHEVRWRDADIEEMVTTIRTAARDRASPPRLDVLVQHVEITDDRAAAAARLARGVSGLAAADALSCPFVLIGSAAHLIDEVRMHHERWGISRFTVRAEAFDVAARLIEALDR